MTEPAPSLLVSTQWLAEHLADPELRLFDATAGAALAPGAAQAEPARAVFEKAHIPGARYLDLKNDLSDTSAALDFTRLPPEAAAAAFASVGIGPDAVVVVYSTSTYGWATRVWWLLNDLGFRRVAVLDGGLAKWVKEGRPTANGTQPAYPPAPAFEPVAQRLFADLPEVAAVVEAGGATLVNALSPDHFSGAVTGPHGRSGRIPGSISLPAGSLVAAADNSLKPLEVLKAEFAAKGISPETDVIAYCGSGIAATLDGFVLKALGHDRVRVYDGSLSEWSKDPQRPLEA
ncbi:sulfurtransferase [Xanthobacter oligotrophicus]|uniref:sulfurtransferase n=1 Tax=Xanthobacter oligotrophicus TaxID=2607286 RepID=UPI0011F2B88B|nr:sulfurtransferase [Xanthobacter oligotrophicus]MCG5235364.1 sulfurtransferase [Xanthobacter oligotrophicus]